MILVIFGGERVWRGLKRTSEKPEKNYVVVMEKHTYREKGALLDINMSSLEEMLSCKVSMSHGKKIIEYREITGGFEDLKELMRISGIGKKTYDKLRGKFFIEGSITRRVLNINGAEDRELLYFGFTKKEIKRIREYLAENNMIFDNIALLEIMGEERYYELKDYIKYD